MPVHFEVSPKGLPVVSATDGRSLAEYAANLAACYCETMLSQLMSEQERDPQGYRFQNLFQAIAPRMAQLMAVCSTYTLGAAGSDNGEHMLDVVYGEGRWLVGDAFDPPPAFDEPERPPAVMPPAVPVSTTGRKPRARNAEAIPA